VPDFTGGIRSVSKLWSTKVLWEVVSKGIVGSKSNCMCAVTVTLSSGPQLACYADHGLERLLPFRIDVYLSHYNIV